MFFVFFFKIWSECNYLIQTLFEKLRPHPGLKISQIEIGNFWGLFNPSPYQGILCNFVRILLFICVISKHEGKTFYSISEVTRKHTSHWFYVNHLMANDWMKEAMWSTSIIGFYLGDRTGGFLVFLCHLFVYRYRYQQKLSILDLFILLQNFWSTFFSS